MTKSKNALLDAARKRSQIKGSVANTAIDSTNVLTDKSSQDVTQSVKHPYANPKAICKTCDLMGTQCHGFLGVIVGEPKYCGYGKTKGKLMNDPWSSHNPMNGTTIKEKVALEARVTEMRKQILARQKEK